MDLLLVSHKGIASGVKETAGMIVGEMADDIAVIELTAEQGVEHFTQELEAYLLNWLTEGKVGIIFADLMGGTPYNRAEMMLAKHELKEQCKVVSGMNVCMVIDALEREIDQWDMQVLQEIMQVGQQGIGCMDLLSASDDGTDE